MSLSILLNLSVHALQPSDTSATRTAIAITREPILGTPVTPNSINLTTTAAFAEYETRLPLVLDAEGIPLYASASAIVFLATQTIQVLTGSPLPTLTPLSTATELPCQLTFYKNLQKIATSEINEILRDPSSTLIGFYEVIDLELLTPNNCSPKSYHLGTNVEILLKVPDLQDDTLLIAALEELLLHLQKSRLVGDGQSLRLLVQFYVYQDACKYRVIDTGFNNARLAYKEGLRGNKLIEALGGIMDTNQDLSGYC